MKEWLVVDGYNVINSWQDFRKFREENLEHARELLKEKLAEYIAFKGYSGIVVFDAQEVQGVASFEKNGALEIVFTNEGETADSWIERRVYDLVKSGSSVFVVTSDYAEQLNVLGSGAYRISPQAAGHGAGPGRYGQRERGGDPSRHHRHPAHAEPSV